MKKPPNKKQKQNKTKQTLVWYPVCTCYVNFRFLLRFFFYYCPKQRKRKTGRKRRRRRRTTTTTTTNDDDDMCARVHWRFVCLRGRRFWALPACPPACLTAARSRSHHAPAPRTKLTTDSRLLSLSQEPSAYENLSANQKQTNCTLDLWKSTQQLSRMIRDASGGEGEEEEEEENQGKLKERQPKIHGDSRVLC